jgi:hypothetical protein
MLSHFAHYLVIQSQNTPGEGFLGILTEAFSPEEIGLHVVNPLLLARVPDWNSRNGNALTPAH